MSSDSHSNPTDPVEMMRLIVTLGFAVAMRHTESIARLGVSIKHLFDAIAAKNASNSTCAFAAPEHTQFTDPQTGDVYAVTRTGLSWRKRGATTEDIVYVPGLVLSALHLSVDGHAALVQLESISRALRTIFDKEEMA